MEKSKEFTKKNKADLIKEIGDLRVSLRDVRFGVAGSKDKNVKRYANIKKDIARLNTMLKKMHAN
jgi:ribosomal protein L29